MGALTSKLKKISNVKKQLKEVLSGAYSEEQVKPLKFEQFPQKFKAMSDERTYLSVDVGERLSGLSGQIEVLSGKTEELSGKTDGLSMRTAVLEDELGVEYAAEFEDITDKTETVSKWLDTNGNLNNGGKTTALISKEDAEDLYFTGSSEPFGNPRVIAVYGLDGKIVKTPDGKPASYGGNTKIFRFPLSEESILKITGGSPYSHIRASSYNTQQFKLERHTADRRIPAKRILDGYPRGETELEFTFDDVYLQHLSKNTETDKYPWYVKGGGGTTKAAGWKTTDFIPVTRDSRFLITGYAQWATAIFNFYSFDKKPLYVSGYEGYNVSNENAAYYLKDYSLDISAVMETNPAVLSNIAYVRFCGGTPPSARADCARKVCELEQLDTGGAVLDLVKRMLDMSTGNILFNRKYVSIGDSFTSPSYSYANVIAARN